MPSSLTRTLKDGLGCLFVRVCLQVASTHRNVIRFSPPFVIEEGELRGEVKVIGECLTYLDKT